MGGLVGGLIDLFGGNPTEKEQNQLGSLAGYDTGTGEGLVTPGAQFEEDILSGDPAKISQALAPEITAGQNQVQQQAKTNAEFGTRSGGTAASTNAAEGAERGNIINLVGGLQSSTAQNAVNQGSNLLTQASSTLGSEANLAEQRRRNEVNDANGIAQGVASIAAPFLAPGAAADPYEALYSAQNAPDPELQPQDLTEMIQ